MPILIILSKADAMHQKTLLKELQPFKKDNTLYRLMAFAVADISGAQYKVSKGDKIKVPFMGEKKEGDKVTFDQVLLLSKGKGDAQVGKPHIKGASVEAKVLGHGKSDKVIVFKMKHRKRTRKTQGHRQQFTEIEVTKVNG